MAVKPDDRSWFEIDGSLPEIDAADAHVRSPESLVAGIIADLTEPGGWILDPFAGFGTSLHAAIALDRKAVGFEIDAERAAFVGRRLTAPSRIIRDDAETADLSDLPICDLLITSPPYTSVGFDDVLWGPRYFSAMETIFRRMATLLRPDAPIVVEISNVRTKDGFRPLAFQFAHVLSQSFDLERDLVRCNSGDVPAGPGMGHSHLLVFANRAPRVPVAGSFGDWEPS